jgi:hypothetical protein
VHHALYSAAITTVADRRREGLFAKKQELVRQEIWEAAIDLFDKVGFDEVTVDQIANKLAYLAGRFSGTSPPPRQHAWGKQIPTAQALSRCSFGLYVCPLGRTRSSIEADPSNLQPVWTSRRISIAVSNDPPRGDGSESSTGRRPFPEEVHVGRRNGGLPN